MKEEGREGWGSCLKSLRLLRKLDREGMEVNGEQEGSAFWKEV